jgi:hypothetical protein
MPAQFLLETGRQFHSVTMQLALTTFFQPVVALAIPQAYRCNRFYEAFIMWSMTNELCKKLRKLLSHLQMLKAYQVTQLPLKFVPNERK